MELVRSNRTEILVDALASQVRDQPLSPFEQETIVVQSRGLESWLTLELARRLGVWGNPSFPFPRHLGHQPRSADGAALTQSGPMENRRLERINRGLGSSVARG